MAAAPRRPPAELKTFLQPYGAAVERLFLAARAAVLAAAPDANELIYDAYNTVSAVFTFSDRMKEGFVHVAAYRGYVNLGFNRGAGLPDPDGLLVGSGKSIRHIRIDDAATLQRPAIQALLRAAADQGREICPAPPTKPHSRVQAVSPNQRRPVTPSPARGGRSGRRRAEA